MMTIQFEDCFSCCFIVASPSIPPKPTTSGVSTHLRTIVACGDPIDQHNKNTTTQPTTNHPNQPNQQLPTAINDNQRQPTTANNNQQQPTETATHYHQQKRSEHLLKGTLQCCSESLGDSLRGVRDNRKAVSEDLIVDRMSGHIMVDGRCWLVVGLMMLIGWFNVGSCLV